MLGHRTLTIEDYLTILKRRWLMIVIPAIVLPIVALGISYRVTPVYTSQTLILVEQPKVPDEYVKSVVDEGLDSRLASMREQILSRSRLEPIIKQYDLANPKDDMDTRVLDTQKAISIKAIHSELASGGLPGFYISFKAGDAHTAQPEIAPGIRRGHHGVSAGATGRRQEQSGRAGREARRVSARKHRNAS